MSLICVNDEYTSTTTYATKEDFINEAKLPGRILAIKTKERLNANPIYGWDGMYAYDVMGRLTDYSNGEQSGGHKTFSCSRTYADWEPRERPTKGIHSGRGELTTCQYMLTWSYDDLARTVNASWVNTPCTPCGNGPGEALTTTYDADGIIMSADSQPYDIKETGTVCSD